MKIAYVLYNERPNSGLIRTQVISLLKEIKRQAPQIHLTLIAFWQPWVGWKLGEQIRKMREEVEAAGIEQVDNFGAIIPSRHFLYKVPLFPVLHAWVRLLFRFALRRRFDIVHCRAYLGSYVAVELKQKLRHRAIFDMRSLWPKEHVSIGAMQVGEPIFRMWSAIEKFTLEHADASIGVSAPMIEEMRRTTGKANAVEIPICVDTEKFRPDDEARARRRRELGWADRKIIVHHGNLGLLHKNIEEVAEYMGFIRSLMPDLRFLILTTNRRVDIPPILERHGLAADQFAIRYPEGGELNEWLAAGDVGLHAMSPGPDSATRLGVKIVEFLSSGLPFVVNPHVGAAAELARSLGVGAVIDAAEGEAATPRLRSLFERGDEIRKLARQVALERFSVEACARSYLSLYSSIAGRKD